MLDFEEIVKKRYATKLFDKRKVEESTMKKLYELIRLAPSSYNLQPWKIKVITDEETKVKLQKASFDQPQITTCSHLLIFCADTDLETKLEELADLLKKNNIPEDKLASFESMLKHFISNLQGNERLCWAQRQVYLALGNALNGAKALGLDSCPMEGFIKEEYSRILNLPKNLVPTVVVPIGYAADTPRPKIRLPQESIFF